MEVFSAMLSFGCDAVRAEATIDYLPATGTIPEEWCGGLVVPAGTPITTDVPYRLELDGGPEIWIKLILLVQQGDELLGTFQVVGPLLQAAASARREHPAANRELPPASDR